MTFILTKIKGFFGYQLGATITADNQELAVAMATADGFILCPLWFPAIGLPVASSRGKAFVLIR